MKIATDVAAHEILRFAGFANPSASLPGRSVNTRRGPAYVYEPQGMPSGTVDEAACRKAGLTFDGVTRKATLWVDAEITLDALNGRLAALGAPTLDAQAAQALDSEIEARKERARLAVPKRWASFLARPQDILVLDTETTSLQQPEAIHVSLVRTDGSVVVDALVMPQGEIDPGAASVHGHTKESLAQAGAKDYREVHPMLFNALHNAKGVIGWNVEFDCEALRNTAEIHIQKLPEFNSHCVMRDYALLRPGERYRLVDAMQAAGIAKTQSHSSLDDCRSVIGVMQAFTQTSNLEILTVRIPYPVSANKLYVVRNREQVKPGQPDVALSKEGKDFRDGVRAALGEDFVQFREGQRLLFHMVLHAPKDGRKHDVDNTLKSALDALERAGAFPDDEAVDELQVQRGEEVDGPGYADIQIRRLA